jgi:hypothetical protein
MERRLKVSVTRLGGRQVSAERFVEIAAGGRRVWDQMADKGRASILPVIPQVRSGVATTRRQTAAGLNACGEIERRAIDHNDVRRLNRCINRVDGTTKTVCPG